MSLIAIFLGMIVVKLYISPEGQISLFSGSKHSVLCYFKTEIYSDKLTEIQRLRQRIVPNEVIDQDTEFQLFQKWTKDNSLVYRLLDNKRVRIINISTYEEAVSLSIEIKQRWYEYLEQCYVEK